MGEINVFYGPMRNGKTKRLLEEFNEQLHTGQNVKIFKPLIDSRFSDTKVISRNGMSADAINLTSINDLANYDAEVYLIDEFQFLNGDLDTIEKLSKYKNKKFYISGLNYTSDKKPFGKMLELISIADNAELIPYSCEICHEKQSLYSYFNGTKTSDIHLGDSEYISVCENCYNELEKKRKL